MIKSATLNPTTMPSADQTPIKQQPQSQTKTIYRFGAMNIPQRLVFYEKDYVYAMVPLAQKLQGRIEFSSSISNRDKRYHPCSKETSP